MVCITFVLTAMTHKNCISNPNTPHSIPNANLPAYNGSAHFYTYIPNEPTELMLYVIIGARIGAYHDRPRTTVDVRRHVFCAPKKFSEPVRVHGRTRGTDRVKEFRVHTHTKNIHCKHTKIYVLVHIGDCATHSEREREECILCWYKRRELLGNKINGPSGGRIMCSIYY